MSRGARTIARMALPPAWQAFLDDPDSDEDEVAELAEALGVDGDESDYADEPD